MKHYFLLSCWIIYPGRSQLSHHRNTSAGLSKNPHGKEPRPLQTATWVNHFRSRCSAAVKPSDTCSPSWCLDYNQVRDLEIEPFRLSRHKFLAYRNSEISVCCLKSPSFGVTCMLQWCWHLFWLFIWLTSSHLWDPDLQMFPQEAFTNLVPQDLTRCVFLGLPRCPGCVCIPSLLQCLVIIYISDSLTRLWLFRQGTVPFG